MTSPWRQVLADDLHLAWSPTLAATPLEVRTPPAPAAPVELPVLPIAGGAAAAALLLGAWLVARARRPRLVGSMSVLRDGAVVREFVLDGRTARIEGAGGVVGTVTARRRRDGVPAVSVRAREGGHRQRGTLLDGDALVVGDHTIAYTGQRTRMLDMIGTGGRPLGHHPVSP